MTPERWRHINEVFESAIQRGEAADEFLRNVCAGDGELYSEVRRMFDAHQHSGLLDHAPWPDEPVTQETGASSGEPVDEFTGSDRFEVRRKLGEGGMGAVYEVWDREREQRLALKTLTHVRPEDIIRFKREFRTLSAIVHPNLVRLYELIGEGDRWFFTMELLDDAQSLMPKSRGAATNAPTRTEVIAGQARATVAPLPPRRRPPNLTPEYLACLRDRFRQLAEAVLAIHKAGKLHRDLKPSNVMVKADGTVAVLDFGLALDLRALRGQGRPAESAAKPNESWDSLETTGGTIEFMAPEQALGLDLTEASDWYAFGATLYQCLTGQWPFEEYGRNPLPHKIANDGPRPSLLVQGVPPDLDCLVELLLRRHPEERPDGPAVLAALSESEAAGPASLACAPGVEFVGRARQMRALESAFERLRGGTGSVLQVSGPSGYGKSALLGRFLDAVSARPDVVILSGRCYEQEAIPYKAADSIMDSLALRLMRESADELAGLLPASAGSLAQLFPVLLRVSGFPSRPTDGQAALNERRREAFHALREILARVGERYRLVIAIDDVQWADADSAVLLEEIFRPQHAPRALLICSHRSEYTGPFLSSLDALGPERLAVDALAPEEARELALRLLEPGEDAGRKAQRIAEASFGSPYFVAELARHVREGLSLADTVDLDSALRKRIERLPADSRQLLEVTAVAGSPIELRSAHEACAGAVDPLKAVTELRDARLLRTSGVGGGNLEIETYHDRVREAILAGLDGESRKQHHGRLANTLEAHGQGSAEALAFHCEHAGFIGKAAGLYQRAAEESIRSLALDRAEALLRRAAELAPDLNGRTSALERLVHLQTNAGRFQDAYATGREAAEAWGVCLPRNFEPPLFAVDLLRFAWLRRGKTMEQLAVWPQARDERTEAAVRLMAAVGKAAYQIRPELCISVMAKIVNLSLRRGMTPECSIGFMALGAIFLGGILGRHRTGAEFGELALRLVERFSNDTQRAEVNFVVGYFGTSWCAPAAEAERLWQTALEAGQASGDLFHTGCAACATVLGQFLRGVPLQEVWLQSEQYYALARKYRLTEPAGAILAVRQAIRNLRGETRAADSLSDTEFDEDSFRAGLAGFGSRHFAHYYHVARMQALVLRGLHRQALDTSRDARPFARDSRGMLHGAEHSFYHAFAALALADSGAGDLRAARKSVRWFGRLAGECQANFASRAFLLEAEATRREGRNASRSYQQALDAAESSGHLHLAGLAAERSGDLTAACRFYERWGAAALLESIDERKGTARR